MLATGKPIVLIDVLDGRQTQTLPNAKWLAGAGAAGQVGDPVQERLGSTLAKFTGGDKTVPVVNLCLNSYCWLSYNSTLRTLGLGYQNVYWYRGGHDAWAAAGLPLVPITEQW